MSSEVWCFCTAHSLHPIQTRFVLTRDRAHLLLASRPLVSMLIRIVDFSHFSILESFCINQWLATSESRSGNSSKHRVDTVAIIHTCSVSTSSHTEWLVELIDGGRWRNRTNTETLMRAIIILSFFFLLFFFFFFFFSFFIFSLFVLFFSFFLTF